MEEYEYFEKKSEIKMRWNEEELKNINKYKDSVAFRVARKSNKLNKEQKSGNINEN